MKKLLSLFFSLLIVSSLAMTAVGCGGDDGEDTDEPETTTEETTTEDAEA